MGRHNPLAHCGIMVAAWYTCLNPQAVLASPTGTLWLPAGSLLAPRDSTYCVSVMASKDGHVGQLMDTVLVFDFGQHQCPGLLPYICRVYRQH